MDMFVDLNVYVAKALFMQKNSLSLQPGSKQGIAKTLEIQEAGQKLQQKHQ